MATVLCMDGLGGHPETTFGELETELKKQGHVVWLLDIPGIRKHADRVAEVMAAYRFLKQMPEYGFSEEFPKPFYFIGQSAGASAVRIAVEKLHAAGEAGDIAGIVLLSPAMPWGIFSLTKTLFWRMARRINELLFAQEITMSEDEFLSLVSPIPLHAFSKAFQSLLPIQGREARELAFFPPKLGDVDGKRILHVWGDQDCWIAPRAQRKLFHALRDEVHAQVEAEEIKGAGHLTLASDKRFGVILMIADFIKRS